MAAELVISAFLGVLFEKLASTALKNIARYNGIDTDIKKWQRSLTQIQGVLTDASRKEITSPPVKRWLNDLQHLAYDIDDVIDELATEAMHREFTHDSQHITTKVRKLIPSCFTDFSGSSTTTLLDKLDDITTKLQDLVEEKAALGLRVEEEPGSKNKNRRLQTSLVDASSIVGRQAEKEALVHKLLGGENESCEKTFSIVPIVGMGGVGKTTLARLLYDEKQVKDHFELKAWVCVSDEFDSFDISKVIFQSVTGESKNFADLNLLQVALRDHLRGKRFLLVLDDVWSESCEDWETLVGPFHACAPGSKIIMTTRKVQLLRKLGYNHLNQLESLSHENALSLISLHALGVNNFDLHLSLKPYALGIVKKCDGLPLALKALGRLLSEIIPALKLSYHDLSARLKQLFAYCSLFPKDFMFDKDELVLLWMGEGFLHRSCPRDSTEESIGHEYFDELLSRSFFQHAPNNQSFFVMHDMMNDLATYVASEFFVRLDFDAKKYAQKEMLEKYRHMSFVSEEFVTYKKFEAFKKTKSLRTFLATSVVELEWWKRFHLSNKILADLLPQLPLLRVLCLSKFEINEVPETIGTLRHLSLANLPNNFLKLKNLRHLDIRDTPCLDQMPLGIDELTNLQTLSKIIIGGKSRFEFAQLKDLENLCGGVSIIGLEKVKNALHARQVNFLQKKFTELEVIWSDVLDGSRNEKLEKNVLNELKPCNDKLKELKIRSYGGLEFPNWVGDPLFLRLSHVSISKCKRCTSLPPLAQLPVLKELFIEGLDAVKVVGMELLGFCHEFASLEILCFQHMSGWTEWSANRGVVFPCLKQLIIKDCPSLVEVTLEALPSLSALEIDSCDCGVLERLVESASALNRFEIKNIFGLNDMVWRGVVEYLGAVKELSISKCNIIRYLWKSEAVASKALVNIEKLKVSFCDNLVSLGEKDEDNRRSNLLTSLRILEVLRCENMESCSCPDSIETLSIRACTSVTRISLPTGGKKLKSLTIRGCGKLLETEWGGQKMNNKMLEYVDIYDWSNLKSIIELKCLIHLTTLRISDCKSLESFPENEFLNLTSLKELEIKKCPGMDASFGFWPPNLLTLRIGVFKNPISEWGPQNFPTTLVDLHLYGGEDAVRSCSQLSHLLPSSLTSLHIYLFKKLESVSSGLEHLTCLKHLGVYECPKVMDLPQVLLPSLLSLMIISCQNLNKRCSKRGCYWPLISHIPSIHI
ncbi:hypothetical protein SSX86_012230 [Deinandra increscens subsp. villosa]|uniref:NB-ARC domains-containing protein n=1 Tax=Deinandra increscens subsp. villosa TaxID=3103831 RepID=A0AAP0D488_9ASTR